MCLTLTELYNNYSTKLGTTLKEKKNVLNKSFDCIIIVIQETKVATKYMYSLKISISNRLQYKTSFLLNVHHFL